jgi:ATP-dependent DNA helicase DinG
MGNKTYKLYDYLCEKENYESRDSQKKFFDIVQETIDNGGIKIIQAPTGTGKTYGYLIPIIESQQKAIISTGTKLLQEQLRNDVDNLKSFYYKLTGNNVFRLVMKGKNNYLCLDRFNNYQGKPAEMLVEIGEKLKTRWDGDKEFLQKTDSEIWNKICVDEDYCTPYYRSICKYKDECLYWAKLRSKESQADILIVNHALLALSDFGDIEKEEFILVIDEAHELDKYITSALTKTISTFMLKGILDYIKQFLPSDNLDVEKFFNNLNEDFSKLGVGDEEVPLVLKDNNENIQPKFPLIEKEKSSFLNEFKEQILDPLEKYKDNVRNKVVDDIRNRIKRIWIGPNLKSYLEKLSLISWEELSGTAISDQDSQDDEELIKKLKIYEFLENRFIKVKEFYKTIEGNQGNYGLSISREYNENLQTYNYIISLFPISPKGQFNLNGYKGAIITSATADPEDLKSTLGIEGDFTNLPHNFSYGNVKFCICDVNPSEEKEKDKWIGCLKQSFKWLKNKYSKVLVLLTNKEDFKLFGNEPGTAFLRKDEKVSERVEDLKKGRIKALVGLDRLWFGVDVPGEKGILIARIPFEYPGDPLNFYRERYLGEEEFWKYYKRKALIKFKQGIGRMMRTRNDGGTIILCDNKISKHEEFMKFIEELKELGLVVVKKCKCDDDKFLEEIMKSDKEK